MSAMEALAYLVERLGPVAAKLPGYREPRRGPAAPALDTDVGEAFDPEVRKALPRRQHARLYHMAGASDAASGKTDSEEEHRAVRDAVHRIVGGGHGLEHRGNAEDHQPEAHPQQEAGEP